MPRSLTAILLPGPLDETPSRKALQLRLAVLFLLFIIPGLGVDSVQFRDAYFDGRHIVNVAFIAYFFILYYAVGRKLQRLMFVMVPLSYLGELLCSEALGMYDYKNDTIPLYVPFGHALVYASGYIVAKSAIVQNNRKLLRSVFPVILAMLFMGAWLLAGDVFSAIFGMFFFLVLRRKKWDILYYCVALCAVFVEFTGTFFGCWVWKPEIFGILPAANPPVGAVFIYVGGDVILAKLLTLWDKKKMR
jgi:hypothetical protein